MASPYRSPAPPPQSSRFARALVRPRVRVLLEPERVRLDAPDWAAVWCLLLVLGCGGPFLVLALAVVTGGIWPALGLLIAALLTARVHLRVRAGRATLVRTVLFIPWSITRRGAYYAEEPWIWLDWDDSADLIMPPKPGQEDGILLLMFGPGFCDRELEEIEAEIQRLLGA